MEHTAHQTTQTHSSQACPIKVDQTHAHHHEESHKSLPFWFGNEDPEHVEKILNLYSKTLLSQAHTDDENEERFIGQVKRNVIGIPGELQATLERSGVTPFITLELVTIYFRDEIPLGYWMRQARVYRLLVQWDPNDGLPLNFLKLDRRQYQNLLHGNLCNREVSAYLLCLPVFRCPDSYEYRSSLQKGIPPLHVGYSYYWRGWPLFFIDEGRPYGAASCIKPPNSAETRCCSSKYYETKTRQTCIVEDRLTMDRYRQFINETCFGAAANNVHSSVCEAQDHTSHTPHLSRSTKQTPCNGGTSKSLSPPLHPLQAAHSPEDDSYELSCSTTTTISTASTASTEHFGLSGASECGDTVQSGSAPSQGACNSSNQARQREDSLSTESSDDTDSDNSCCYLETEILPKEDVFFPGDASALCDRSERMEDTNCYFNEPFYRDVDSYLNAGNSCFVAMHTPEYFLEEHRLGTAGIEDDIISETEMRMKEVEALKPEITSITPPSYEDHLFGSPTQYCDDFFADSGDFLFETQNQPFCVDNNDPACKSQRFLGYCPAKSQHDSSYEDQAHMQLVVAKLPILRIDTQEKSLHSD